MTQQKPKRKPPIKTDENTDKAAEFAKKLQIAINGHFGVQDARLEPRKLWAEGESTRYRVNWWDWDHRGIIKTAFIHVTVKGEGDKAEIQIKEII